MRPTSVLATVTGRDRPGVTASFFAALAAHDVEVRDVEQMVIRDRLILTVLFDLRGDTAALRNSVSRTAGALGMECEIAVADSADSVRPQLPGSASHVIVMGHPLRPGGLSHIAQRIADSGGNIETVTQLSGAPVAALELIVRSADPARLRASLVLAATDTGVDIAVEPAGLQRRAKRLVIFDVDSTLIQDDPIGVVIDAAGRADAAAAIQSRVAAGDLDTRTALSERIALLAGVPEQRLVEARAGLRLTPGAETCVRTLRRLGYHVGVVSDGVSAVTTLLSDQLELDFVAANDVEVADGTLTGRLIEPVIDRIGKADALRRFADKVGVPLSQTVAVGAGQDDVDMLDTAGLSVAFSANSAARTGADPLSLPYLDSVLFVLGITRAELDEPQR